MNYNKDIGDFRSMDKDEEQEALNYIDNLQKKELTHEDILELYNYILRVKANYSEYVNSSLILLYEKILNSNMNNDDKGYIYFLIIANYYMNDHIIKSFDKFNEYLEHPTTDYKIDSYIKCITSSLLLNIKYFEEAKDLAYSVIDSELFELQSNEFKAIVYFFLGVLNARLNNFFKAQKMNYKYNVIFSKLSGWFRNSLLINAEHFLTVYINIKSLSHDELVDSIDEDVEFLSDFVTQNKHLKFFKMHDLYIDIANNLLEKGFYEQSLFIVNKILGIYRLGDLNRAQLYSIVFKVNSMNKEKADESLKEKYISILEEINKKYIRGTSRTISKKINYIETTRKYLSLEKNSQIDELTLCKNRNAFESFVYKNNYKKDKGCICYLDLDNLKKYNDELGHLIGDKYLALFCKIFRTIFYGDTSIYRLGGDEFVAICQNMTLEEFVKRMETFVDKTKMIHTVDSCSIEVRFSCGIIEYDEENVNYYLLLNQADKLMYKCKAKKDIWFLTERV